MHYDNDLQVAVEAAREAGAAIKAFYDRASAATYTKADGSAVTDADLASDRIIRARLSASFPSDALLTEEGGDDQARLGAERCWIVDPLDGTDQFVRRTGEFDVLIALIVDGRPVVAVAYQPAADLLCAAASGQGAWAEQAGGRFPVRFAPAPSPPRLATSLWFGAPASLPALSRATDRLGAAPPIVLNTNVQPRALIQPDRDHDAVVGLIATADQTMAWEWDFAALDLLVHEAGGQFTDLNGTLHRYNKAHPRNHGGLLASVDPACHELLLTALQPELPRANDSDAVTS